MLYLSWKFLWSVALPMLMGFGGMVMLYAVLVSIILAGILQLVGSHIAAGRIIMRIFRMIERFLRWIDGFLLRIFRSCRNKFQKLGWSDRRSKIVAFLVTALTVLIIFVALVDCVGITIAIYVVSIFLIISGIAHIWHNIWRIIPWFFGLLPRIFRGCRNNLRKRGWSNRRSNIVAFLITVVAALLII